MGKQENERLKLVETEQKSVIELLKKKPPEVSKPEVRELRAMYEAEIKEQRLLISQLTEKNRSMEKLEGKLIKKWKGLKEREPKLKKFVSKETRTEIITEFLKGREFTDNQIRVMVGELKNPKEWSKEEISDCVYLYNLNPVFYRHFYKNKFKQFPVPSPTAMSNWKDKDTERFMCTVQFCVNKTCYSQEQLDKHMAEHQAILCEHCGKGFRNRSGLNNHVIPVHFGIKQWKCKICSADFAKQENLEIHLAVNHLKLCENDKAFKSNRAQMKLRVQEYKERLKVKVMGSRTALITHPNGVTEEIQINGTRQLKNGDKETQNAVKSISPENT